MYFDKFSNILYDFKQGQNGENQFVLVKDITANVRFKTEFIKSLQIYEPYKMKDGETIEIVAEKLYGSPEYHWILMILNDRYDYIEDFPLDGVRLEEMIDAKYKNRKNDTRYYVNKDGIQVTPEITVTLENTPDDMVVDLYLFDNVTTGCIIRRQTSIGNYIARINSFSYTHENAVADEQVTCSSTLTNGKLKVGDAVQILKYYDDADGNFVEELVGESIVNAVDVPAIYTEVTNYEHEYLQNEKKRIIKVIPQLYLQQIINEFESIM